MRGALRLVAGVVGSLALHGGLLLALATLAPARAARAPQPESVEFAVVEVPPPPPPAAEPEPEPPPEPPPQPQPRRPLPPRRAPPPQAPAPPEPDALPPSNAPAPEEAPREVPLVTGLSMSSTVGRGEGSGMRVGVGNTLYGTPGRTARAPGEAQAYQGAETWVPPHKVATLPRVLREVDIPYPAAPREAGIEGRVRMRLRIDDGGRVVSVRVVEGPGHGLDEAAAAALKRFRFEPATVDGRAVGTEIEYTFTFRLD